MLYRRLNVNNPFDARLRQRRINFCDTYFSSERGILIPN
jgi:hypothetical protein